MDRMDRDLGHIEGPEGVAFGTMRQAQALLTLIEDESGHEIYRITYTNDLEETVVITCDLSSDVIIRQHKRKGGTRESFAGRF